MTFYEKFLAQCVKKGVAASAAAKAVGLSNAAATGWKNGKEPQDVTIQKLADYFGCTVADLKADKEKEPAENDRHIVTDDDIKFAFFGGDGDITDAMYEEVKQFAQMVKLREDQKKKG